MARNKVPNAVIWPTGKRKAALRRRTRKNTAAKAFRLARETTEKESL